MSGQWRASWIGPAFDPRGDLGVFVFQRTLSLGTVPPTLRVRLSADQRYKLYVNGALVEFGPQRGDGLHWHYETVDLAPRLRVGENAIVALVWNFGRWAPMAQHTARTAFLVEAVDDTFKKELDTPGDWTVASLPGWWFEMMHNRLGPFYIDVGPGEVLDGRTLPVGWESGALNGDKPNPVTWAESRGTPAGGTAWSLVPRSIPSMRYEVRATPPQVRRGFHDDHRDPTPAEGPWRAPIQLEPGKPLLLDFGELLCAYPRLTVRGEAGSTVTVVYAESMWVHADKPSLSDKGNRHEVAGKRIQGYLDKFVCGDASRTFETAWWRTFRYAQLEADQPVTLESFEAVETGYPYAVESAFEADDDRVGPLWDVSVRTAQRCAGETYFDCPYYEQLQYGGDTRIQILIHYFLSRDRALARNAVRQFGWSLMENGLTQSRYPSRQPQVIPPFSLFWLLMLHDQMLYDRPQARPDFVNARVIQGVLEAYRELQRLPISEQFWQFGDWVPGWDWGMPPGGAASATHTALLELAIVAMHSYKEWLEGDDPMNVPFAIVDPGLFPRLHALGERLRRRLTQPQEGKTTEHEWALYLTLRHALRDLGAADAIEDVAWPGYALTNAAPCSYYFQFYKHEAMAPEDYLAALRAWTDMIEAGLTTFAENPPPVRSDCHAWSAHPALGFFRHVAGVRSDAPGWSHSVIAPRPGPIRRFDARIAHPDGDLTVRLADGRVTVDCPTPYRLVWQGKDQELPPGRCVV